MSSYVRDGSTVSDEQSFLLVATKDLFTKLVLPDSTEWIVPTETLIRSEIEGLVRETPVKYGPVKLR